MAAFDATSVLVIDAATFSLLYGIAVDAEISVLTMLPVRFSLA